MVTAPIDCACDFDRDAMVKKLTDAFGDFEFEGLPANTSYRVKIAAPGYKPWESEVRTGASVYLGDIVLVK